MTITHSVQQEFLDDETKNLICIPCQPNSTSSPMASAAATPVVARQSIPATSTPLLQTLPPPLLSESPPLPTATRTSESTRGERWTEDEHERFLLGMELFKAGPWKKIAGIVGTRDARQTMSHAQKYRQKIKRRKLELQTPEPPRRVDSSRSRASSTTKRMRTVIALETVSDLHAANRVVSGSRPQHVSPRGQMSREALGVGERATGLIPADTVLAVSAAVNVGGSAGTVDGVMARADVDRVDLLNQQLDAAVEPLDIAVDVSVVQPDSWRELWDFLDGA